MSEPVPPKKSDDNHKRPPVIPPIPPQNRFNRSMMMWVVLAGVALVVMVVYFQQAGKSHELPMSEFWRYAKEGYFQKTVIIHKDKITGELSDDGLAASQQELRKFHVVCEWRGDDFDNRLEAAFGDGNEKLAAKGLDPAQYKHEPEGWFSGVFQNLLIMLLVFGLIWFFVIRRMSAGGAGGGLLGGFGRSKHRMISREHIHVKFADVAGITEAKQEVQEIIEFLRNTKRFAKIGGRVPRGVLLVGEPGCGKTLLAKAIAGEADVPFFSISGSDFVEMFVGVGASRVRDLFKQAKDAAPCIVFLDEIDAIGRRRTRDHQGGGGEEREQTLNAILVEMDGFDSSDQVIVLAATNRGDVLDPALTRPGRFDRQITVPLPDVNGRLEILNIYADKVQCGPDVDLNRLARGTPMFSGADLEALVNEAAIAATMADKDYIELDDLEEARDKVCWGRARKSRAIDEKEQRITAYHEAGHALVQFLLDDADPLHKVSIIPRGSFGGATFSLPERDRYLYSRNFCRALLKVCLAGRIAEELFCDDITSGAQNDISQATEMAKKMTLDWGMNEKLGMVNYHSDDDSMMPKGLLGKEFSERTAEIVDCEIRTTIDHAYTETKTLIETNRDAVERLAQALLKYETLDADDVKLVIDGKVLDKPTVGDFIDAEVAKTSDKAEVAKTENPPEIPDINKQ